MVNFCHKEGVLSCMVSNVRKIAEISEEWRLKEESRKALYKCCFNALIGLKGESQGSFDVVMALLKMYEKSSDDEMDADVESLAHNSIVLAIRLPSVVNFEEIMEINALKFLAKVILV
jgi:hypothetical protein